MHTPELGVRVVVSPSIDDGAGLVLDAQAVGTLFLAGARFATFEENNGTTNTSTVRLETHGLFLLQRPDAVAVIASGDDVSS